MLNTFWLLRVFTFYILNFLSKNSNSATVNLREHPHNLKILDPPLVVVQDTVDIVNKLPFVLYLV